MARELPSSERDKRRKKLRASIKNSENKAKTRYLQKEKGWEKPKEHRDKDKPKSKDWTYRDPSTMKHEIIKGRHPLKKDKHGRKVVEKNVVRDTVDKKKGTYTREVKDRYQTKGDWKTGEKTGRRYRKSKERDVPSFEPTSVKGKLKKKIKGKKSWLDYLKEKHKARVGRKDEMGIRGYKMKDKESDKYTQEVPDRKLKKDKK